MNLVKNLKTINLILLITLLLLIVNGGKQVYGEDTASVRAFNRDIKRVALVIGNDDYQNVRALKNAVNDSVLMAAEFKKLGFKVLPYKNLELKRMKGAIRELADEVKDGGLGVFYFAGHGIQIGSSNYLIPVDIASLNDLKDASALIDEAIELSSVMSKLSEAKAKFSLLIIDACRNNPFSSNEGRSIGSMRGLTAPNTPEGMIVIYAAGVNQEALDNVGGGNNGLFTSEFVKELNKGQDVATMVQNVRTQVKNKAWESKRHQQTPAIYIQADKVYLTPDMGSKENEFWNTIKESSNAADFEAYLNQYPNGNFVSLAKNRLNLLKSTPIPEPPLPSTPPKQSDDELNYWQSTEKCGKPACYQAYLDTYPTGRYKGLALANMDKYPVSSNKMEPVSTPSTTMKNAEQKNVPVAKMEDNKTDAVNTDAVNEANRKQLELHLAKVTSLLKKGKIAAARQALQDAKKWDSQGRIESYQQYWANNYKIISEKFLDNGNRIYAYKVLKDLEQWDPQSAAYQALKKRLAGN